MLEILFVCIENSCRSQIAEAFARIHGEGAVTAYSAGSRPSGVVHPSAIASMREIGYDLNTHTSKSLTDIPKKEFDHVITMGCGDECPFVPTKHRDDWDIDDPKDLPPDKFRKIRDEIEKRVKGLIARGLD
jgi:protein-tyrosine-phosphatase